MTIASLLLRFAGIYVAFLIGVAVIVKGLLGIEGNSGINTAALIGAVMSSCYWFAHRNQRYFTAREKPRVVLGMLAIDLGLQAVVSAALLFGQTPAGMLGAWAFALAFIGLLHAIGIYFFVGLTGKQYAKAVEKKAATSA